MPEGPEVKRNTDFLNRELTGGIIEALEIQSGRYEKHGPFKGYDEMINRTLIISEVCCKGKFIYFKFQDGSSLWSTLITSLLSKLPLSLSDAIMTVNFPKKPATVG